MKHYSPDDFAETVSVSRETLDRLKTYAALLEKWQKRINLVGPATVPEMWHRHFLDSAQLYPHLPQPVECLVDLGSGAGFPGMVLAIMGVANVHLVESDSRKCAFLREVARATETKLTIHTQRIEKMPPFQAHIITARALAPLENLLEWAEPFVGMGTQALFLKGKASEDELTTASKGWNMSVERIQSLTDSNGFILRMGDLHRGRADG